MVCPVVSDKSAIVTRGAPESKANGATASFLHLQSKQVTLAAGTLQPRRPSDQAGFALVLTLVVIAVLALVTQMMSAWLTTALEDAIANQHEAEAQQQMADAKAIALYLLAACPVSFRGLEMTVGQVRSIGLTEEPRNAENFIRLDDSPYRLGGALLRFQDARGLINLNLGLPGDIYALLGIFGVPAEDRDGLIDKLLDYLDADSFRRLNGAEAPEYLEAGLDSPANAPLRTPLEVRRVLGWRDIEGLARDDTVWPRLTSIAPVAGFNVNTAPRPLLMLIPSLNSDMVDQIMAVRRTTPIAGSLAWQALTGIPLEAPPARTFYFPSSTVVLTLSAEHWPLERRLSVRQTPRLADGPWVIDYDLETPRAARDGAEETPDNLPISQLLPAAP